MGRIRGGVRDQGVMGRFRYVMDLLFCSEDHQQSLSSSTICEDFDDSNLVITLSVSHIITPAGGDK